MVGYFLRSPDKGFCACLGDLPPDMPRQPETWVSLCNLMLAFRTAPLSSGRIIPRETTGRVTPFIPCVRDLMSSNTLLPIILGFNAYTSASTDAGAALAPLLSGSTRVHHWQSARRLWPDTRRLQLLLDVCCRLVLLYKAVTAFNRRNRSLMTLSGWGRKILLLAIISVPQYNEE